MPLSIMQWGLFNSNKFEISQAGYASRILSDFPLVVVADATSRSRIIILNIIIIITIILSSSSC